MSKQERRQYLRVDDEITFDFRVVQEGDYYSEIGIRNELLGEHGQKYIEVIQYFQHIDCELNALTDSIKEPAVKRYLSLINSKIDCLSRQLLPPVTTQWQPVNLSLGGMAFKTPTLIKEKTNMKIILYTKPKMIPIILDATVVYSQHQQDMQHRTAVSFNALTAEQEQLLSQHILLAQVACHSD